MGRVFRCFLVAFIMFAVVSSSACIGRKKTPPAPTKYITPCNVVGERVLVKADGVTLGADIIKTPLAEAFVDDLLSEHSKDSWNTYTLSCWWAKNIGEKKGLYYCGGEYNIPDLDEKGVIRRYIRKQFTVGFEVESREGVSFVVRGQTHKELAYHLLTVKEVSARCSVA